MGAQSASLTSPSPPTGRPQRAQPPTCQGNERSARAARKRRSKLCSRREVSSLSSGAMAGRSAALLGRLGGSEADPKGVEPSPGLLAGPGAGFGAGPGAVRPQTAGGIKAGPGGALIPGCDVGEAVLASRDCRGRDSGKVRGGSWRRAPREVCDLGGGAIVGGGGAKLSSGRSESAAPDCSFAEKQVLR